MCQRRRYGAAIHRAPFSDYENFIGRQQSDYDPGHLALYGAAAVVLLVFAWTLVH